GERVYKYRNPGFRYCYTYSYRLFINQSQIENMTTQELTLAIFNRIKKFRFIILVAAIAGAAGLCFLAMQTPVTYTSKASIFPLNSGSDVSGSASALSTLFGGSESSKSFTDDASINIIELAQSRTTREEVAA